MRKRLINKIMLISVSVIMAVLMAGCTVEASAEPPSGLVISEVVSSNSNTLEDSIYGQPDWIELYNNSDSAINLQGYSISEDASNQFVFPDMEIKAGEYMLVYCCAQPEGVDAEVVCTGFKLSKSGGTLGLSSPQGVIQTLKVPELETDLAWGMDAADGAYKYFIPTPGAANDSRSFASLEELQNSDTVALKISEVLPESASEDEPYGWVELYNDGDEPIELSSLYITENLSNLTKARMPDIALQPGEYTVLRFTGQTGADELPFSVSAGETTMAVANSMGTIVDMLTWDADTVPGISAGPGQDGTVYFTQPTPGAANGEGLEKGAFTETAGSLRINELLLNNTFSAIDEDGERSEWVELYNASDSTVNLSDYALSDKGNRLLKWRLPSRELEAGKYTLVFLTGKNRSDDGELHASFKLGAGETKLYLTQVSTGTYEAADVPQDSAKNVSYGLSADGTWLYFPQPTPQMPNDAHGFAELSAASGASASGLMINEVATVSKAKSQGIDWVELYNSGDNDLDLEGYCLSDSRKDLMKWPIGSKTVDSGGYAVIKEYSKEDDSGVLDIRTSGETLYLTSPAGVVLDQIETGVLRPGLSRGIVGDAGVRTMGVFTDPTPGEANGSNAVSGYCAVPFFSVSGGYKTGPVSLGMSTTTPNAQIHYTLDGSTPTSESALYSGPITISSSQTVRAITIASGKLSSDEAVATYLFVKEKHSLPVVCLSMAESDFKWVSGSKVRSDDRERAGYVEYYEPDGTLGVRFPAGFRIAGAGTRTHRQKSINLYLRGGYGLSSVTYPFFEDYDINTFKSLSLRNMGQDYTMTCVRDAYFHTIANGMNILNMQSKFAVVYVNGEYWGLYEFKENQNEDYLNAKFGIDQDDVEFLRSTKYAYKGDSRQMNQLFSIAAKSKNSESKWNEYMSLIDVDYFTDYLIMQTYISNNDYYNQKYTHTTDNSLTWRPMFYDLDFGLKNGATSGAWAFFSPGGVTNTDEMGVVTSYIDMGLFYALYCNDEWRDKFVRRYAEVMNTTLSTEHMLQVFDEMVASIEDEMPRHIDRWNTPSSMNSWENNVESMRNTLEKRRAYIIRELTKRFDLSSAEVNELWPNG